MTLKAVAAACRRGGPYLLHHRLVLRHGRVRVEDTAAAVVCETLTNEGIKVGKGRGHDCGSYDTISKFGGSDPAA